MTLGLQSWCPLLCTVHALSTLPRSLITYYSITFEVMARKNSCRSTGKENAANLKRQKMMTSSTDWETDAHVGVEAEVLEESDAPSYGELTEGRRGYISH